MARARKLQGRISLIYAVVLATAFSIGAFFGIPAIESVTRGMNEAALQKSLGTFRTQIDRYQRDHNGQMPTAADGGIPQLIRPTNETGTLGASSNGFPYGPYLKQGIPVNPLTGCSIVTPIDTFPPTEPSGNGGWLYHAETGQVAADVEQYLGK